MEKDDFLKNYLEEYRKTDGYKENHRLMVLCKDDWRTFLAERIRKTQGKLPKGEMLFWAAFLFEPEVCTQRLKQWIAWCKENGTIGQRAYAVISEKRLIKSGIMSEPQPNTATQEADQGTKEGKQAYQPISNKRKSGRPSKPFNSVLVGDDEKKKTTLETLHNLVKDKTNSKAVLYIKTAIRMGLIQKPTYTQFTKEFGQIASRAIYNKYVTQNLFSDDEIEGAKQALANAQ